MIMKNKGYTDRYQGDRANNQNQELYFITKPSSLTPRIPASLVLATPIESVGENNSVSLPTE
jgi:hypothetical protein